MTAGGSPSSTLSHERGDQPAPARHPLQLVEELLRLADARRELRRLAPPPESGPGGYVEVRLFQLHNWRSLTRLPKGEAPGPEGSALKLYWSEMSKRLHQTALDVLGDASPLWNGAPAQPRRRQRGSARGSTTWRRPSSPGPTRSSGRSSASASSGSPGADPTWTKRRSPAPSRASRWWMPARGSRHRSAPGLLGELGADVIKVELPGEGDFMRTIGPFVHRDEEPDYSLSWAVEGRGRRGVTCDLRRPEGQDLFRRLAAKADVLCENFRPGTMEALARRTRRLRRRARLRPHQRVRPGRAVLAPARDWTASASPTAGCST